MTVLGEGPRSPRLVLVGEAPGDEEVRQGRPFVGAAGKLLDETLDRVGIDQATCYVTNLVKEQPTPHGATSTARNDFGTLYLDASRKAPTTRLIEAVEATRLELQALYPCVVVPLGNEPLRWLTGRVGILGWRGSLLQGLGETRLVPTVHPAAVLRQWDYYPAFRADLAKALAEATTPTPSLPRRTHVLHTLTEVGQQLAEFCTTELPVSFDIETAARQVTCIAFAQGPTDAYVIPIWSTQGRGSLWTPDEELSVWEEIQRLFQTCAMVGHNVHYDLTYLRAYDVFAKELYMDTMAAWHVLQPELPKGLDYLTSVYTDIPYYKWMASAQDAKKAWVTPPPWTEETFWEYNGLDALATWRCSQALTLEMAT